MQYCYSTTSKQGLIRFLTYNQASVHAATNTPLHTELADTGQQAPPLGVQLHINVVGSVNNFRPSSRGRFEAENSIEQCTGRKEDTLSQRSVQVGRALCFPVQCHRCWS